MTVIRLKVQYSTAVIPVAAVINNSCFIIHINQFQTLHSVRVNVSLVTCDLCVFVCFQGIVSFAGKAHQVMLQGVHELYELNETPQLWEENLRINRLVFIGEDTHTHINSYKCITVLGNAVFYGFTVS